MIRVQSPRYVNSITLQPANIYARPVLPVLYDGMFGVGYANRLNQQQFEYTMRQMAASPFSVNSGAFMERVRDEYGYTNDDTYNALGIVGGVVGAGLGAALSTNMFRSIPKRTAISRAIRPVGNLMRTADMSYDAARAAAKTVGSTSRLSPYVGTAVDIASLGLNVAGLTQSIEQGDVFNTAMYGIGTVADALAVVGDVLEYTPYAAVGHIASTIAGVVSIGVSALQGFLVGRTVGRSLSPEGLRAQQLFAENLYAGIYQRPITSLATLGVMVGIQGGLGRLANRNVKFSKTPIRSIANTLTNTAVGNQVRSGIAMLALQGTSAVTSKLDEYTPFYPDNPEDVSFVNAISLFGDINDNLFGATRNKSVLVGLASGDSAKMIEAFNKSWGMSDDIYTSVSFDDIRKELDANFGVIGNALFSTLGEMIIDPQNYAEAFQKIESQKIVKPVTDALNKTLQFEEAKTNLKGGIPAEDTTEMLVAPGGILRGSNRKNIIESLIRTRLERGEKALNEHITRLIISSGLGMPNTKTFADVGYKQGVLLKDMINNAIKGNFKYNIIDADQIADIRNKFSEFEKIQTKIDSGTTLTEDEAALKINVVSTFNNLVKHYGEEKIPELVNKFISDIGVGVDTSNIAYLYSNYEVLKQHMDMVDNVQTIVAKITRPTSTLYNAGKFTIGKVLETLRYIAQPVEQKQKTIIKLTELKDNIDAVIKRTDIETIKANQQKQQLTLEEALTKIKNDTKDLDAALTKDVDIAMEKELNTYEEQQKQLTLAQTESKAIVDRLAADQAMVFKTTRTQTKAGTTIYVDQNNIKTLQEELKIYETGPDGKPLTPRELKYKKARDKFSLNASIRNAVKDYEDKLRAVTDYLNINKYHETTRSVLELINAGITTLGTLNLELHNETVELLTSMHVFKVFANTFKQKVVGDVLTEEINNLTDSVKDYKTRINNAEKEIKSLTKKINKLQKSINNTTVKTLNKELDTLNNERAALIESKNKNSIKRAISDTYDAIREVNKKLKETTSKKDIALLNKQHKELQDKLDSFKTTKVKNKYTYIQRKFNNKIKELQVKIDEVNTKLNDETNRGKQLERRNELIKIQTKLTTLNDNLLKDRKTLTNYEKQLNSKVNRYQELESKGGLKTLIKLSTYDQQRATDLITEERFNQLQRVLMRYGLTFTVKDENGNDVVIDSRAKLVNTVVKAGAPLQLKYRYSVAQIVHGAIFNNLSGYNMELLLKNISTVPVGFKQEDWNKWGPFERFEAIRKFINSIDWTEADKELLADLLTEETLHAIYNTIDASLSKKDLTVYTQLEDVSDSFIKRVVLSGLFNKEASTEIVRTIDGERQTVGKSRTTYNTVFTALDFFKRANEAYLKILNDPELKNNQELIDVLKQKVDSTNIYLVNNDAYKFVRSTLYPNLASEEETGIFYNRFEAREIIPYVNIKNVTDSKSTYKAINVARNLLKNPVTQQILNETRPDYILYKGKDTTTISTVVTDDEIIENKVSLLDQTRSTIVRRLKERRNKKQGRIDRQSVFTKMYNKAKEAFGKPITTKRGSKNILDAITPEMINNISTKSDLYNDMLPLLPYVEHYIKIRGMNKNKLTTSNKAEIKVYLLKQLLNGSINNLKPKYITHTLKPSSYISEDAKSIDELINYYQLLDKHKRNSPGHEELLTHVAKQLLYLESQKQIIIDPKVFENKRNLTDTRKIRYIKDAYKNMKLVIHTLIKSESNERAYTYNFKKFLKEAIMDYMIENSSNKYIINYDITNDYKFTKKSVEDFTKLLLSESVDHELNTMRLNIFNKAIKAFDKSLATSRYNNSDNKIKSYAESLHAYEQKDKKALYDRNYVVSNDVVKKELIGYEELDNLINAIIDPERYGETSPLMDIFYMLEKYVQETSKGKRELDFDKVKDIKLNRQSTGVLINIDGTFYNMFDLTFIYRHNKNVINNLIRKALQAKAKLGTNEKEIIQINAVADKEYDYLIDTYGKILTRNALDVTRDLFEGTDEEYALLTDIRYSALYNTLTLKDALVESDRSEVPSSTIYDKIYTTEFLYLYNKASANINKPVTYKGETVKVKSIEELMLIYLMEPNKYITEDKRILLLHDVFFYDMKTVSAQASATHITELEETLEHYNNLVERLKELDQEAYKYSINEYENAKIPAIKKAIKDLKAKNEKVINIELNQGNKLEGFLDKYKYLKNLSGEELLATYSNTINTSSSEYTVALHTDDTYRVVKRSTGSTLNVDDSDIKGVPSKNIYIGERIIGLNDPDSNINKTIRNRIASNETWNNTLNKFEVKAVTDRDILIVHENPKYAYVYVDILKRSLNLGDEEPKNIYIVSEKQYNDILDMYATKEYVTTYDYKTKVDEDGNILGLVNNVINVKGSKVKVEKYLNDLQQIGNFARRNDMSLDEAVSKLQEYHNIVEKYPIVHRSYSNGLGFFKTEYYKDLKRYAQIHRIYKEFVRTIDPTMLFEDISLDTINKLFFNSKILMKNSQGEFFNVDNILDLVEKPDVRAQLTTMKINGELLLDKIKEAITKIQDTYGGMTIRFTETDVFNKTFIDKILSIKRITASMVTDLRKNHKDVYRKIVPIIKKRYKSDYIHGVLPDELSERNRVIVENISLFNEPNKKGISKTILKPYANFGKDDLRRKVILNNKNRLRHKSNGTALETILKTALEQSNKKYTDYKKAVNTARRIAKSNSAKPLLNYKLLKEYFKDATKIINEDFLKSNEESINEFTKVIPALFGTHDDYTNSLFGYLDVIFKTDKSKLNAQQLSHVNSYEHMYRIFNMHYEYYKEYKPTDVEMAKLVFKSLSELVVNRYTSNLFDSRMPKKESDLLIEFVMAAQNKSEEESTELYKKTLEKIEEQRKKFAAGWDTSLNEKDRVIQIPVIKTLEDGSTEIIPNYEINMEDFIFARFFGTFYTEATTHGVDSVSIDFKSKVLQGLTNALNEAEDSLYYSYTKKFTQTEDVLTKELKEKTIVENEQENKSVYNNLKDYINSFPKDQQELAKIMVDIILNRINIKNFSELNSIPKPKDNELVLVAISESMRKDVREIVKRNKNKSNPFTSNDEVLQLVSLPILNNDTDFKQYVRAYLGLGLDNKDIINYYNQPVGPKGQTRYQQLFGVKMEQINEQDVQRFMNDLNLTKNLQHLFIDSDTRGISSKYNNMYEILSTLKDTMSLEDFYNIVTLINVLKLNYLNTVKYSNVKNASGKPVWSFSRAIQDETDKELESILRDYDQLAKTGGFDKSDVYGNSLIDNINNSVQFIETALDRTGEMNDVLGAIINTKTTGEVFDLTSKYITTTETTTLTHVRKANRDLLKSIFKDEKSISYAAEETMYYTRLLGSASQEIISETVATSVDTIASDNETYNKLRKLYTNVMRIVKFNFADKQFVKIREIAIAFKHLMSKPSDKGFYINELNKRLSEIAVNKPEYVKEVEKYFNQITEYFNKTQYLVNTSLDDVKATFGLIYFSKYGSYKYTKDKLHDLYLNYSKDYIDANKRMIEDKYKQYAYLVSPTKDLDSVAIELYGMDTTEMAKNNMTAELTTLKHIRKMQRAIEAGLSLDPSLTYDTAIPSIRNISDYNSLNKLPLGKKAIDVKTEIKTLKSSVATKKGVITKFNNMLAKANTDIDTYGKELQNEYDLYVSLVEAKQNYIDNLKNDKEEKKKQLMLEILNNNPELLAKWIEARKAYVQKDLDTAKKEFDKLIYNKPDNVIKEYLRRYKDKNDIKKFYQSPMYKEYVQIKLYLNDGIEFKDIIPVIDLDKLNLESTDTSDPQLFVDKYLKPWYDSMVDTSIKHSETQKELRKYPKILGADGKVINYYSHISKTFNKKARILLAKIEGANEYLDADIIDFSDNKLHMIVKTFLYKIVKDAKNKSNKEFKSILESKQFKNLTQKRIDGLVKSVNNDITTYSEKLKNQLSEAKALGYKGTPEDVLKNIVEDIDLYSAEIKTITMNRIPKVEKDDNETKEAFDLSYNDALADAYAKYKIAWDYRLISKHITPEDYTKLYNEYKAKALNNPKHILGNTQKLVNNSVKSIEKNPWYDFKLNYGRFDELISLTVNNSVKKSRKVLLEKNLRNLNKLKDRMSYTIKILSNSKETLKALKKTTKVNTLENVIQTSAKKVLGETINSKDVVNYIINDNNKLKLYDNDIKTAIKEIKILKDETKKLQDKLNSYTKMTQHTIPTYKSEETRLNNLLEEEIVLDKMIDDMNDEAALEIPGNASNLGTYKTLYKDELEGLSDQEIINKVISDAYTMFPDKEQHIKEAIENTSKGSSVTIHNPVVDSLITMYNYIGQMKLKKKKYDNFVVFDMETVKDEYGGDVPYLITAITYKTDDNGKPTIDIISSYFNNTVFFDKEITVDGKEVRGPLLTNFYKQQYDMWKATDPTLTDEWIENNTNSIIKRAQMQKNSIEMVEVFITILNNKKTPIVAHAGERFDFPNYNRFISNFTRRLLPNIYYHELRKNNPDEIAKRLRSKNLQQDYNKELLKEYEAGLQKIVTKFQTGAKISDEEFKQWQNFIDAILKQKAINAITDMEVELGIIVNQDLKDKLLSKSPDSELSKLRAKMYEYIKLKGDDLKRLNIRNDIVEYFLAGYNLNYVGSNRTDIENYVDRLLLETEAKYERLYNGIDTLDFSTFAQDTIRSKLVSKYDNRTSEAWDPKNVTDSFLETINAYDDFIKALDNIDMSVEETVEIYNNQIKTHAQEIANIKTEIQDLLESIDTKFTSIKEANTKIIKLAETINKATNKLTYKSNVILNKYLNSALESRNFAEKSKTDTIMLRSEMAEQIRVLNEQYTKLQLLIQLTDKLYNQQQLNDKDEETTRLEIQKILETTEIDNTLLDVKNDEELKDKITSYQNRIKELNELKNEINNFVYSDDVKVLEKKTPYLSNLIKNLRKSKTRLLEEKNKELLELWNSDEFQKLIKLSKNSKYRNITKINGYSEYKDLFNILQDNKQHKDNSIFKSILQMLGENNEIESAVKILQSEDYLESTTIKTVITSNIDKEIVLLNANISYANTLTFKKTDKYDYKSINKLITDMLQKVESLDNINSLIERKDLFNLLRGKGKPSSEMDKDEFKDYARQKYSKEDLMALEEPRIKRYYKDALENDKHYGFILDPNKVYRTENYVGKNKDGESIYNVTITVYDDVYETVQQMSFNTEDPTNVTFNLTYNYKTYDTEALKPKSLKIHTLKSNFKTTPEDIAYSQVTGQSSKTLVNIKQWLDQFYWSNDNKNGLIAGLTKQDIIHVNGIDPSFESIKKLLTFYQNHYTSKGLNISDINKSTIIDKPLKMSELKLVDLDAKLEQEFLTQVSLIQTAKRGSNYKDIIRVYTGLVQKMFAKYNSMVNGAILNLIPAEYSRSYILEYDAESMRKFKIDPLKISEGSAGSTLYTFNHYTTNLVFTRWTNPIRTQLTNPKIYSKYTKIGIIGEFYEAEDANIAKGIVHENFMDNYKLDNNHLLYKFLNTYTDAFGKKQTVNLFTPHVGSRSMLQDYEDDILHKIGLNVPVAFANDPRANNDTIIIDRAYAKAMGWNNADKTWIGNMFGFKGAVRFVDGVYDTYKAVLVASADSAVSRGTLGVYVEMFFNNLRLWKLDSNNSRLTEDQKTLFSKYDAQLQNLYTMDKGKIVLNPTADFVAELNKIFISEAGSHDPLDVTKTKQTPGWLKCVYATVDDLNYKDIYVYKTDSKTGVKSKVTYDVSKGTFYRGEVYVFLDSAKTADKMANRAVIDKYGDITYTRVDLKDSTQDGVVVSPSVLATIKAKGGIDIFKAFPPRTNKLNVYTELYYKGLKYLEKYNVYNSDGTVDYVKTINKISAEVSSNVAKQYTTYLHWSRRITESPNMKILAEHKIATLDRAVKQYALKTISGPTGAYYKSNYRKHEGIREQLVANVNLGLGELRVSKLGWDALVLSNNGEWLLNEVLSNKQIETILQEYPRTFKYNDGVITDIDDIDYFIEFLHGMGFTPDTYKYNKTAKTITLKTITDSKTNLKGFGRQYGYIMAIRSPVQDYNATPLQKVIGYNTHSGTEANVYMYDLMGADNDGDTIGMVSINTVRKDEYGKTQYDYLKNLDGTKVNYYSDGYIDGLNKGSLSYSYLHINGLNRNTLGIIDPRTNWVGKKTFNGIRNRYTWDELYMIGYKDIVQPYINSIKVSKEPDEFKSDISVKDPNYKNTQAFKNKRFYVNVIIREHTKGFNNTESLKLPESNPMFLSDMSKDKDRKYKTIKPDYNDVNSVETIYQAYKEHIWRLVEFEKQVENKTFDIAKYTSISDLLNYNNLFNRDERAYIIENAQNIIDSTTDKDMEIKDGVMYNKLYTKAVYATTMRIQGSKRGINVFGSNRKKQLLAVVITTFYNINKDNDGNFWKQFYDENNNIVVSNIISSLLGKDAINHYISNTGKTINPLGTFNTFYNKHKNIGYDKMYKSLTEYMSDAEADYTIKELYDFTYNILLEAQNINIELTAYAQALNSNKASELLHFMKNNMAEFRKEDPLIKNMIEKIENSIKEDADATIQNTLDFVDNTLLNQAYFGRFTKDAEDFKKGIKSSIPDTINLLQQTYYNQILIDRKAFNVLSKKATEIIAVAKHFGIDTEIINFINEYSEGVKDLVERASIRRINMNEDDYKLSMSMAFEKDPFKDFTLPSVDPLPIDRTKLPKLQTSYKNTNEAINNLNQLIADVVSVELIGINRLGVPDILYDEITTNLLYVLETLHAKETIDRAIQDPKFIRALQVLVFNDIPSYRVMRMLLRSYSVYKTVNSIAGNTVPINSNIFLKNSLTFFEQMFYLYDKQTRLEFDKEHSNEIVKAFFLNSMDMTDDFKKINPETGDSATIDIFEDIDSDDFISSNTFLNQNITAMALATDLQLDFKNVNKEIRSLSLANKVLIQRLIKDMQLGSVATGTTIKDVLQQIMYEWSSANQLYKSKETMIDNLNKSKQATREDVIINTLSTHIFNYFHISKEIAMITDYINNNKLLNNEIKELQNQLAIKETKVRELNKTITDLTKQADMFLNIESKAKLKQRLIEARNNLIKRYDEHRSMLADYAFSNTFSSSAIGIFLHTDDGQSLKNLYDNKPKYINQNDTLTDADLKLVQNSNILNMEKYQKPLLDSISMYGNRDSNGMIIDYDYDALYKFYKKNRRFYRLTVVMKAYDDETLAKRWVNLISKEDTNKYSKGKSWDELSAFQKSLWWNRRKRRTTRFNSVEDLEKFMAELNSGSTNTKLKLTGSSKSYSKADITINLNDFVTPTLKEIDIKSAEDMKNLIEFAKANPDELIGFSDLNSIMSAMEQSYNPFKLQGKFSDILATLQATQKLAMRLSVGFLVRNAVDTYHQLVSEMIVEQGSLGAVVLNGRENFKHIVQAHQLYSLYKYISEERLLSLSQINLVYIDTMKIVESYSDLSNISANDFKIVKANVETIKNAIQTYVDSTKELIKDGTATPRITYRAEHVEPLLQNLSNLVEYINTLTPANIGNLAIIKDRIDLNSAVTFIMNMNFSEYYLMRKSFIIDVKQEQKTDAIIRSLLKSKSKTKEDDKHLRQVLFEISAFMNTNAQIDQYRQETYAYVHQLVYNRKQNDLNNITDLTYDEVIKEINIAKGKNASELYKWSIGWNVGAVYGLYNNINENIENTGRIAGFLLDRYINGYTFNESVNNSLRRFFNYGQRSAMEMSLITDIPYLSFPIRSIDNWIDRLVNPQYLRVMSDIIDGVYSQFEDEDGQYDEFTQFQIANGWIPLGKNFGLRIGNGAFDVANILSDPAVQVEQRISPTLRAMQSLVKGDDIQKAAKQLATTGVLTRLSSALLPRGIANQIPVIGTDKPRSIGSSTSFTYDRYNRYNDKYTKYTPHKYRNNGRYTRYENIYRDWFNKYGRMRKPKVDPMSLVKDIQWRQYVRYRRSRNIL